MDYEKKLKLAKEALDSGSYDKETIEYIFPELKAEDERIREQIISFIEEYGNPAHCEWQKDWIAWLEKQGETFTKKDVDDAYLKGISDARNELEKQGEQKPDDKIEPTDYNSIDPHFGKPIDKIEPKFKVGDWIVNRGHSYLIADIDYSEQRYLFEIGGYTHEQLNWEYIELADKRYHLWTLEDAKDGDVLVSQYNKPFIYNGHYNEYKVGNHCGIECTGEQFIDTYNEICWTDNKSIKPATKEQRDLLFAKMHEAGYEWDKEKKELWRRFCESENYDGEDYGIDGLWHAKNILEETIGKVDGYQTDDGILEHKCAIAAVNKLYKQKPTQSEDETSIAVKNPDAYKIGFTDGEAYAKEEMQSSWSEEDEKLLKKIMHFLSLDGRISNEELKSIFDWLKSLKPQNTWKPSDEQLRALHDINLTGNISYAGQGHTLIELYNDLKKLYE